MLSLILTYYNQPKMLAEQARIWATYQNCPEIIVVDDGSKIPAMPQHRSSGYRVGVDIPWHQDGARNLGAHVATGEWLLFLDIDHTISASALAGLQAKLSSLPPRAAFRPQRRLVDNAYRISAAANIWLIRKSDFWMIGGYDERLCGSYGTDLEFRPRLRSMLRESHISVTLDVYRSSNISDASTGGLDRTVVIPSKMDDARKCLEFPWSKAW